MVVICNLKLIALNIAWPRHQGDNIYWKLDRSNRKEAIFERAGNISLRTSKKN